MTDSYQHRQTTPTLFSDMNICFSYWYSSMNKEYRIDISREFSQFKHTCQPRRRCFWQVLLSQDLDVGIEIVLSELQRHSHLWVFYRCTLMKLAVAEYHMSRFSPWPHSYQAPDRHQISSKSIRELIIWRWVAIIPKRLRLFYLISIYIPVPLKSWLNLPWHYDTEG